MKRLSRARILRASRRAPSLCVLTQKQNYRLLQFTAPVSAGSSGGVLIDAKGDALGIVCRSVQGQNLNFAVPIDSVLGLANAVQGKPFGSGAQSATSADQSRTARKIYIIEKEGGAFSGFPAQPLEKKLLENRNFQTMGFLFVTDRSSADILITLDRPTSNDESKKRCYPWCRKKHRLGLHSRCTCDLRPDSETVKATISTTAIP